MLLLPSPCRYMVHHSMGSRHLNSGPHACAAPTPPKHPQLKVAKSDYECAVITHPEAWGESGWVGKNDWKEDEGWLGHVSGNKKPSRERSRPREEEKENSAQVLPSQDQRRRRGRK